MKKWIIFMGMVAILAGCSSGGAKETKQSETDTSSTSSTSSSEKVVTKTKKSIPKKKTTFKDAEFQIEGTGYKIKIPDSWNVTSDEDFDFYANNAYSVEAIMIYGTKKIDFEGLEFFKNAMIGQIASTEDVQIKEETRRETDYQTIHYPGYFYSFTGTSEGANAEFQYYFLETETDYVVVNIFGLPSFYNKNPLLIPEVLNSFVTVDQMNTQEL